MSAKYNTFNFQFGATSLVSLSLLFISTCAVQLCFAIPAVAFDHTHKIFAAELRKYVESDGVEYSKWKNDQQGLDKYLEALGAVSEDEYKSFDLQQKEAFWLNAYNALAVKLILSHYPIHGSNSEFPSNSIRQIPNTWEAITRKFAGRDVTLYSIAHDILRRDRDCRTHFAVSPATKGGGELQREVFEPKSIEHILNEITKEYMARPENLSYDLNKGTITVSQIFKWFPLDFLGCTGDGRIPMPPPKDDDVVRDYVTPFLPREVRAKIKDKPMQIIYAPYDWKLNESGAEDKK